ncbi:O-antigen ligase family protein [Oscillochloris sp. ZM17-4]|nr:O-antigen ligase family protein [Oscillochloris sp. ZM17-4]
MRRSQIAWWLLFLGLLGLSGVVGFLMNSNGPSWSVIAWIIYFVGIVAIFYNPRYGVYMILGFTLMGDQVMLYWYPFTKNFSSAESIMFLSRAVNLSPLESYMVFTLFSWFGRMAMERRIRFRAGPLFWPAAMFTFFITVGLAYGVSRGGAFKIALWEVRSIYYLPIALILTGNLIQTRDQLNKLIWIMALAIGYKGLAGVFYIGIALNWDIGSVEQIGEHSLSIHYNAFFILAITVWFYHDSVLKRLILPILTPFMLYSFLANHRRAGFLTLGLGIGIVVSMLYRENRKLFFTLAPTGLVVFLAYLAAFWNNTGSIGMIARAVRSVVGQPTARDAASNVYRDLENINSMFNIKSSPIFGLGFGNKFHIVAPMPDISFFEWWEYITHNSIMWIWMEAGVGAFFAMLLLTGMTMIVGGRAVWNVPRGPLRAVALTATLYVFMHFTYAYADMSWEGISMTFVGTMMGLINSIELIASRPLPAQVKRWPWVPDRDAPLEKRWPWVPDSGVLPPYRQPKVWPMPVPAYRAAQASREAARREAARVSQH